MGCTPSTVTYEETSYQPQPYVPPSPVYVQQAQPVYVQQPQPVYIQQPAYQQPQPMYAQPQPMYAQQQPMYAQPQPMYAQQAPQQRVVVTKTRHNNKGDAVVAGVAGAVVAGALLGALAR